MVAVLEKINNRKANGKQRNEFIAWVVENAS
jgi:hypothetical protein